MRIRRSSAQSSFEYIGLAALVVLALAVMYPHIRKYITGRWHSAGDAISFGMVYQGEGKKCSYDGEFKVWYSDDCYEQNGCDNACHSSVPTQDCQTCLNSCSDGC